VKKKVVSPLLELLFVFFRKEKRPFPFDLPVIFEKVKFTGELPLIDESCDLENLKIVEFLKRDEEFELLVKKPALTDETELNNTIVVKTKIISFFIK